jgi:hypothetical protein
VREIQRSRSVTCRARLLGSLAFLVALCGTVGGIPVVGSGSIPITPPGTDYPFWPPPPQGAARTLAGPKPVGVKVSSSAGQGKILALPYVEGGCPLTVVPTQLGHIQADRSSIYEGTFDHLILHADTQSEGTYETRGPTDGSIGDAIVGEGSTRLLPSNVSFGVYGSFDASCTAMDRPRLLLVRCATLPITIASGTTDLLTVDAADWGLCSQGAVKRYSVRGTGAVPVDFKVLLPLAPSLCDPSTPVAFSSSGVDGDTDTSALDGALTLDLTLANASDATVTVTSRVQGQADHVDTMPPNTSLPLTGKLDKLELHFTNTASPSAVNTVALTVVAHP